VRTTPPNNKAADPFQESAATTIAAAGMPPEPRERDAVILAQAGPLVNRALIGWRRTKLIRHAGPHARCAGTGASETRRFRQAEGTGLSQTVADRTRAAASQPARAVRGRPRVETRVEDRLEGNAPPTDRRAWCNERAGLRSSRGSRDALDRSPTDRPDSGTSVPLPGSARSCDDGEPHRREATWRHFKQPTFGAGPPAPARPPRLLF
jgi:hypothetical protein